MINSDNSIQNNIKFTFTVYEYILYIYICIYIYVCMIYIYDIYMIYIHPIYIYIYIYIYISDFFVFLFIATLSQLIHMIVIPVSHSYNLFQLVLLVQTAYPIMNMIQVINKEARAT